MKICRLTTDGLARLHGDLVEIKDQRAMALSRELLTEGLLAEVISPTDFKPTVHATRFSLATELEELIRTASLADYTMDAGFWGWLTVVYFDQVCPAGTPSEPRKIGAFARYYPELSNWRHYYRHLVAGPWMIYHAHVDNPRRAIALLTGTLDSPGEIVEQLASRQELVTNPTVMDAVRQLYFDASTGKLKRGSARKTKGGPRRLVDILSQFDVTFDLYSVTPEELLELLPSEFDEFKAA